MDIEKLIFYTDGASHGNPGESGVGIVMCDSDCKEISTFKKYIGNTTNNVAEYVAFIIALQEAVKAKVRNVHVFSDSELLVRQVQGIYRVRDDRLKQMYALFENLKDYFKNFSIEHIDREKNIRADKLAEQAIRERK
jgi:ribonuclease HI